MLRKAFVVTLENDSEYQPVLNGKSETHGIRSVGDYPESDCSSGQPFIKNTYEEMLPTEWDKIFINNNEDNLHHKGKVLYKPPHIIHDTRNLDIEYFIYLLCGTDYKRE